MLSILKINDITPKINDSVNYDSRRKGTVRNGKASTSGKSTVIRIKRNGVAPFHRTTPYSLTFYKENFLITTEHFRAVFLYACYLSIFPFISVKPSLNTSQSG